MSGRLVSLGLLSFVLGACQLFAPLEQVSTEDARDGSDAGTGSESDASHDAGADTGADAGTEAGTDAGQDGAMCPGELELCSGACVDLASNIAHCGRCDRGCGSGQECFAGRCKDVCSEPTVLCGTECVDTQSNLLHCGGCESPCGSRERASVVCKTGACERTCDPGYFDCNHDLASASSDGCEKRFGCEKLVLVSAGHDGQPADAASTAPSVSRDGRFIAFESWATNLVLGDTNQVSDIFVFDRLLSTIVRVSVGPDGSEADGQSSKPMLSADGRFVAFISTATNLVVGDDNGAADAFLHDLQTGVTERVSVGSGEPSIQADAATDWVTISQQGRWVAFKSFATNLAPEGTADGLFLHDRETHTTQRFTSLPNGVPTGNTAEPTLSADGTAIAFASTDNLAQDDLDGLSDVFVTTVSTQAVERVSPIRGVGPWLGRTQDIAISEAGRFIAYASDFAPPNPFTLNVFLYDRLEKTNTQLDLSATGNPANDESLHPSLSGDGDKIVFTSSATNLIDDDQNGFADVFLYRRGAPSDSRIQRISVGVGGEAGNGSSTAPVISGDGSVVAFESTATNFAESNLEYTGIFLVEVP